MTFASDKSTGEHSVTDSTPLNATIDNTQYVYWANVTLDPDADNADVLLRNYVIIYTILIP